MDRPFITAVRVASWTGARPGSGRPTVIFEMELTSGKVLLVLMKELQELSDAELRDAVRTRVASAAERRSYERLSENASHDTLLLLSARALAHQRIQLPRRRVE